MRREIRASAEHKALLAIKSEYQYLLDKRAPGEIDKWIDDNLNDPVKVRNFLKFLTKMVVRTYHENERKNARRRT